MPIDQHKLTKEFIYTGRGTAAELIAGLDQIAPLEAKLKARPALIRWAIIPFLLVCLALAVFVHGAFTVLAIAGSIGLLIWAAAVAGTPVLHDRVEFLRLTLNMLNEDSNPRGHFDVKLNLRRTKIKLTEGPNPRAKSGKQTLFSDVWQVVRVALSDGTALTHTATDLIRQRTKRNPRGKIKTKERVVFLLRIQLAYNPALYGDASVAARHLRSPFRMPAGSQLKTVNVTDKSLSAKAIIKANFTAALLHSVSEAMLLGAYRTLNLARGHTAASSARGGKK